MEFFRRAAEYGDLYVGIGSDKTIEGYKHHKTVCSEQERLFMVKSIRYVKDAFINAGTWIDQPYVSCFAPGWAITISLEPTFEVRERCGLSTSTRNMIKKIWPYQLPNMDPEILAKLVFCFENALLAIPLKMRTFENYKLTTR